MIHHSYINVSMIHRISQDISYIGWKTIAIKRIALREASEYRIAIRLIAVAFPVWAIISNQERREKIQHTQLKFVHIIHTNI